MVTKKELMSLVKKAPNGCWEYTGYRTKGRCVYGVFHKNSKAIRAHRLSYELFNGPIKAGLVIDHLCRNTVCVNPKHLEAVTSQTNSLRGIGPAAINKQKKECVNGHPLSGENLRHRKDGNWRRCVTCEKASSRRHYEKKRLAQSAYKRAYEILRGACEYAVGPTRDVKTPRLREALTKAEAILGGRDDA